MVASLLLYGWGSVGAEENGWNVASRETFEKETFPGDLRLGHHAVTQSVEIVEAAVAGGNDSAAASRSGVQSGDLGQKVLKLSVPAGGRRVVVAGSQPLARNLLGDKDRVVFQADVFVPAEMHGSISVIATTPEDSAGQFPWQLYRFGISEGRVFLTYINLSDRPLLYLEDTALFQSLKRSAWHRMQLTFEGTDRIICAVDGVPTVFSPVNQEVLQVLKPALMAVSSGPRAGTFFADNFGVSWSRERTDLPPAPYQPDLSSAVAPEHLRQESAAPIRWYTSLDEARREARAKGLPTVIFFFREEAKTLANMEKILRYDPSSHKLFQSFVAVKIDTANPTGNKLASQLAVYRFPSFVAYNQSDTEIGRVVYDRESSWPAVSDALRKAL